MKLPLTLSVILVLAVINHNCAQSEVLFNGVELQDSFQSTKAKMEPFAEKLEIFEIENPTFPLSKNLETHLVLQNYKSGYGTISELVFTFADDKLVYVQAFGRPCIRICLPGTTHTCHQTENLKKRITHRQESPILLKWEEN